MKPLKLISRSEANQQYLAGYLPDYKQTGWQLDDIGKHITFTDGCGIGRLRLVGNKKQHIETFPVKAIKRVRLVRRADGYYVQFGVKTERSVSHVPSGKEIGIDVGLKAFLTDSQGNTVENPRHYRKAEKNLKRLGRRLSRKQKHSSNRKKARKALAKQHLIPICVLRDISKMREVGHRTEMLRIGFQLVKSFTHLVNHGIKRGKSEIRELFFA